MTRRPDDGSTPAAERNPVPRGHVAARFGDRIPEASWLARAAGVGLCVTTIAFVLVLVAAIGRHGRLALLVRPPLMRVALVLPYLVAVAAGATIVGAALAWRRRYWSLAARLHQTLLAAVGAGVVWQLSELGFLWW